MRALADRGVLVERDGALVLAGELGELDVPPSLISLLGARLDALGSDERELVRSMYVFGGNFPLAAAQALSGMAEGDAGAMLASLVRKQVLTVRADPHSPDRGRYRFNQMLLRTVAYETLSKRERKSRRRAAAHYLWSAFADEGRTSPKSSPRIICRRIAPRPTTPTPCSSAPRRSPRSGAALRAAAVGAPQTAERAYRTAIELAAGKEEHIELLEAAGDVAMVDGRYDAALELFENAAGRHEKLGREREAAALASKIGHALRRNVRTSKAIDLMSGALALLSGAAATPPSSTWSLALRCSPRAAPVRRSSHWNARSSSRRHSSFPRPRRSIDLQGSGVRRAQPFARGTHPVRGRHRVVP